MRAASASNVIEDFADAYARGETPIPCVRCNERVKFADLMDTARELGAEALATGHYVRRVEGAGGAELHAAARCMPATRAISSSPPPRRSLIICAFRWATWTRARCARIAAELGLVNAAKPDSQDICFVPAGRYTPDREPDRAPTRRARAKSWTRTAPCWAAMTASPISRSASARVLGLRAMKSRCSCSSSMRPRRGWWWGRARRWLRASSMLHDVNWLAGRRSTPVRLRRSKCAPCARPWPRA